MTASRLLWCFIATGNLALVASVLVGWRWGWLWALLVLVGGPLVVIGGAVIALILFFLIDGGLAREVPCEAGCGRLAPVQLRGQRYRRPLCHACERALLRLVAGSSESGVRVHSGPAEEWKL